MKIEFTLLAKARVALYQQRGLPLMHAPQVKSTETKLLLACDLSGRISM